MPASKNAKMSGFGVNNGWKNFLVLTLRTLCSLMNQEQKRT